MLDVIVTEPELSLAVGSDHVTAAVDEPSSVLWTISDGTPENDGLSSSAKQILTFQYSSLSIYLMLDRLIDAF